MTLALPPKPGLTGASALSIPTDWDPAWFRRFITNYLKGADVRNAVGAGGITVSGSIASPFATITGSGSGSTGANPTAKVELTAVNGTATTFMRSDASPPIDEGITPLWTGQHTFDFAGGIPVESQSSGNYPAFGAFAGGFYTTDANSLYPSFIMNNGGTGGYGLIWNNANNSWALGYGPNNNNLTGSDAVIKWNTSGAVTIATPSSTAYALTVNGYGSVGQAAMLIQGASLAGSRGLTILAGQSSSDFCLICANVTDSTNLLYVDGAGNLTINAASGTLITTITALTNGSGALAGTLTNSPVTGNPTKWIPISDGGTVRHIPAW